MCACWVRIMLRRRFCVTHTRTRTHRQTGLGLFWCEGIMLELRTTCPSCSYSNSWCNSPRLGVLSWPLLLELGLLCISPGAGRPGSFKFRFIRMLDLRRARSTSRRMLPDDCRRESSCWIPAFIVAAAARECGGVWEALGECARVDMVVDADVGAVGFIAILAVRGVDEGDGDGGSEFRSGGMAGQDRMGYGEAAGTGSAAAEVALVVVVRKWPVVCGALPYGVMVERDLVGSDDVQHNSSHLSPTSPSCPSSKSMDTCINL